MQSSLIKKYLMALTGIVLVGFVFVHMAGNLQVLIGQEAINAYAHALQNLPAPILWGSRLFLLLCVVVHAVTAYQLIKENRAARPNSNEVEVTKACRLVFAEDGVNWLNHTSLCCFSSSAFHYPLYISRIQ